MTHTLIPPQDTQQDPAPSHPATRPVRSARRFVGADVLVVLCLIAFVVPLVMAISLAFRAGDPGDPVGWTLAGFERGLAQKSNVGVLIPTVVYAAAVTAISTIGAVYFAWLYARTNAWLRAILPLTMIVIIVTPSLFYAVAFDQLASPRAGLLNQVLRAIVGSDAEAGPLNAQSWPGMIAVASIRSLAFSFVLIAPAMLKVPRLFEEAAHLAGAGRARTLFTVIVPVVGPSILGAAILAVIQSLEAFEIPLILGGPAHIEVLSTRAFALLQGVAGADYAAAAALSLPIIIAVGLLVSWQRRVLDGRDFTTVGGKASSADRMDLGRTRAMHSGLIGLFVLLAVLLPIAQVIQSAFGERFGDWSSFTSRNIDRIGQTPQVQDAISNSWTLAVFGGLVVAIAAVVICWVGMRTTRRRGGLIFGSVWMATALPGILLSVALFTTVLTIPGLKSLFGTVWLLFFAFFIASMPVAVRAADGPVRQIDPQLYEASRVHGASPVRAWISTVMPLLSPAVLASWFVAAVMISSNVAVPLLLATPTTTLLPVEALARYRQGEVGLSAALILINLAGWLLVGLVVLIAGRALAWRKKRASISPTAKDTEGARS